jgi:hypothetical protein
MQKSHLLLSLVLILATLISYGVVQMTEARPVHAEVVATEQASSTGTGTPMMVVKSHVPAVFPLLATIPDAATLFVTGATLLAIAAGVRRHAC